jgi:integrase
MKRSELLPVQVFSIAKRATSPRRPYWVRWRVAGRDRLRSFKTRPEAERLRTRLHAAVLDGEPFDIETGFPLSWLDAEATWWTWSQTWLAIKWPQWAGHTRRSAVESLLAITPLMTRSRAPTAPPDVVDWLRMHGYRPSDGSLVEVPEWLDRWSVPMTDIDPALLERVLLAATTKRDGSPASREVARRRRTALNAVLRSAVRRGLLDHNPMDKIEWKAPSRNIAVDVSTLPSYGDVIEIVDLVASLETDGARYAALFATVGLAGARPSEAIRLHIADLDLPRQGWGLAVLRGATTSPGTRYTSAGAVVEDKELKQRAPDAVREVPLGPDLVNRLRWHLSRWPPVGGRLFTNAAGRAPTTTNYGPVWGRARAKLWPPGHLLAGTTVYDLRHTAATVMLRAGVPPAEAARRLGHSVDVLMRVYAGVFANERERSNDLIDRFVNPAVSLEAGDIA